MGSYLVFKFCSIIDIHFEFIFGFAACFYKKIHFWWINKIFQLNNIVNLYKFFISNLILLLLFIFFNPFSHTCSEPGNCNSVFWLNTKLSLIHVQNLNKVVNSLLFICINLSSYLVITKVSLFSPTVFSYKLKNIKLKNDIKFCMKEHFYKYHDYLWHSLSK